MIMGERIWLVTTEHLKDNLWFKDEEDFKTGMNYVAVSNVLSDVGILAFVLMSNHVHFVLGGYEESARSFISRLKQIYSRYYRFKYSSKEFLRNNKVDLKELSIGDDSFERAVAYVQMNPVAANVCASHIMYPWGTGNLLFCNAKASLQGTKVKDLSKRRLLQITHSKVVFPPNYILDERGYISPASYVQFKFVESVFRTPKRLNYFLNSSSKARQNSTLPTFSDQSVVSAIKDLCNSVYGGANLLDLPFEKRSDLLKQIRYRFSSDSKQLSRVTGLSPENVQKALDTF